MEVQTQDCLAGEMVENLTAQISPSAGAVADWHHLRDLLSLDSRGWRDEEGRRRRVRRLLQVVAPAESTIVDLREDHEHLVVA